MENHYFIDLFCGAGGVSTGVKMAVTIKVKVIACVNHDPNAILSHEANHPDVKHYTEDILLLDLAELLQIVVDIRARDPFAVIHLWASLECTNFSKAKGGLPRDADSRTLAHGLYRYVETLNPDHIWIENVREFMSWGPLDKNGKPISRLNGQDYVRWCNKMQSYGYDFDWRLLCCADYGDYTSRTRYFAQFVRKGRQIKWPKPTHAKKKGGQMFDQLKPWNPVKEVLDLNDHGQSIFSRKKPLVEKTLKRIYAGLTKFVGEDFLMQYYSGQPEGKVYSIEDPARTFTTSANQAFVVQCLGNNYRARSIDDPFYTITSSPHEIIVKPILIQYNGDPENKNNAHSVDKPAITLTGKDRLGIIQFLQMQYGSGVPVASIDDPAWTITANPKHRLATVQFMSMQYNGDNEKAQSIEQPARTLTKNPKNEFTTVQYLLNPQYDSKGATLDQPCFTLIARMDKMPPYLVSCEKGNPYIVIYPSDSETMVKIKLFMAQHNIVDIKMRMVKIDEMKRITGLPTGYVLIGTETEQKSFIGNAVPTYVVKAMVEAYN